MIGRKQNYDTTVFVSFPLLQNTLLCPNLLVVDLVLNIE